MPFVAMLGGNVGCPYGTSVITKDISLPVMGATRHPAEGGCVFRLSQLAVLQTLPNF